MHVSSNPMPVLFFDQSTFAEITEILLKENTAQCDPLPLIHLHPNTPITREPVLVDMKTFKLYFNLGSVAGTSVSNRISGREQLQTGRNIKPTVCTHQRTTERSLY